MTKQLNDQQLQERQLEVRRSRRRTFRYWLAALVACGSLAVGTGISWPVLEASGLGWVAGLFGVSAAAFLYAIQSADREIKEMWPTSLQFFRKL